MNTINLFSLLHYHHGNGNHTAVFLPLQAFTCGQHLNTSAVKSVHDHSVSVVSVALRADRLKCYCLVFQVVMVAVPTVLGIASIRVYTVSEAPTDGLFTREKVCLSPLLKHSRRQLLAFWLTVSPHTNVLPLLLSPVERLHPSAKLCSRSVCSSKPGSC